MPSSVKTLSKADMICCSGVAVFPTAPWPSPHPASAPLHLPAACFETQSRRWLVTIVQHATIDQSFTLRVTCRWQSLNSVLHPWVVLSHANMPPLKAPFGAKPSARKLPAQMASFCCSCSAATLPTYLPSPQVGTYWSCHRSMLSHKL